MPASAADRDLVQRIRSGDEAAWEECIAKFEGRLVAFVRSRLKDHTLAEDIVQETFIGFLTALPNFDDQTPIQAFLFSIAAHKITDQLRRSGRRPTLPLIVSNDDSPGVEPAGSSRVASSIARSREMHVAQETVVAKCLADLIKQWRRTGEFERLKCMELLFVRGYPNKDAASELGISEQAVANHKYFVVAKLKEAAEQANLRNFDPAGLGLE